MLLNESLWIKEICHTLPFQQKILNIGSSTLYFRKTIQPYIEDNVFLPLAQRGSKITHLDIRQDNGVDIVKDVSQKNFKLGGSYDLVICSNLLEHVSDISSTIYNIASTVKKDGFLIITVPRFYPYHPDPVDNLFRPTIACLEQSFPNFIKISSAYVSHYEPILRTFYRNFLCAYLSIKKTNLNAMYYSLLYFLKKPQVTCILLKKVS